MPTIEFFVPGMPKPGGSKRAFVNRKTGKPIIAEDCKGNKDWRNTVLFAARDAYQGPPLTGPVRLEIQFRLPRPKGHFGTGRNADKLKSSARDYPTVKPDTTKLIRALEDALTDAGIWQDDTQVIQQTAEKIYGRQPGAMVRIAPMPPLRPEPTDPDPLFQEAQT
jgi:Holliday junction resolvase RusA-like endonuclease